MTSLMPRVLCETERYVVVDKPAGLLSQGDDSGDWSLVDWAKDAWKQTFVGLVHRLDRNTSGLMVLAKTPQSAKVLTTWIKTGKLKRGYLAMVGGHLKDDSGWWKDSMVRNEKTRTSSVLKSKEGLPRWQSAKAQQAELWFWALAKGLGLEGRKCSLLAMVLDTGRSHQIRVQAASRSHPLVGDKKYGSTMAAPRPCLHSAYLAMPKSWPGESSQEQFKNDAQLAWELSWPGDLPKVTQTVFQRELLWSDCFGAMLKESRE